MRTGLLLAGFAFSACSAGGSGEAVSSCTVEDNGDGTATISCDDGTEATVSNGTDGDPGADGDPGTPGEEGDPGAPGEDGASCTVADNDDGTATITCGETEATIATGADGTSCTVEDNGDGTSTITCGDTETTVSDGADGAPGSDAEATTIVGSIFCTAPLEDTTLEFAYYAIIFTSGDLFVEGQIWSDYGSASSTLLFAPSQAGYETAIVGVRYDQDGVADGGYWWLSLDRSSLVVTIEYVPSDPGTVSNTWTLDPDACVINTY